MEHKCAHCAKKKERTEKEYKDLINKVLLSNHIKTCVVDNIREGNDEVVDELITMLKKSMK